MRRPPEEMAQATRASWSERVSLAVEDVLALPAGSPLLPSRGPDATTADLAER